VLFQHKDGSQRWASVDAVKLSETRYLGFAKDIHERKTLEEAQQFLLQCGFLTPEENFFESLAAYLAKTLGAYYICIDRLLGDQLTAQTVAVYCDGKFEDNVEYALKDTPCGILVGRDICYYAHNVCAQFPNDPALQELQAECYIGSTLWGFDGRPVGLIAILDRKPLQNARLAEALLKLVSVRAAGELERKVAEEALHKSEEKNRTILQALQDGFWVVDNEGRILEVNERYCEMSGYSRDEFLALWVSDIDVEESPAETAARIERIRKNGSEAFETRHRRKDGSLFDLEMSANLLPNSGGKIIAFGRDITERKRMERYQQLTSEILGILNDPGSFDASLRQIVSAIKRETECDAVGIRLRSGGDYPYVAHDGFAEEFLRNENSLLSRNAQGCVCRDENGGIILECTCGIVLAGRTDPANPLFTPGGSAWTNNSPSMLELTPEQDPRVNPRNNCIYGGYRSVMLIPVRTGAEIVGLLQLNHKEKNRFAPGIIQFFEGIGSSIGTALMRKQAEDALRSSQIRYHALMEQSFEALALIDAKTQEVVEVNRRFTELFGYCLPEDAPLYVCDFVVDSKQNLDRIYNVALWDQPALVPELRRFRHKKGIMVAAERGGTAIVLDGKQYVLASMRDMTEERRRQAELSHDVEFARRVQQGLLPELPESPLVEVRTIYHPSHFVSGDSYHLEWRNDGKILRGFLLDVAGHGLATAIQTSSVNVLLQEPATARLPLLEQLQRVNARAEKYFTDGAYAAILGFELDFSRHELRYVGAGITQFYVNGKKIETPGMFVGMWDDPDFSAGTMPFSPGDSIYFLTDGFTDAFSRKENSEFWLPGGSDFDSDLSALEQLAAGGTLRDDASGVCLHIRGQNLF
jgi:PAS domain S-box-containing protein